MVPASTPFVALAKEFTKAQQTISNFGKHLKNQPGFIAAVERLRLNKETIALQFAQAYPKVFQITRRGNTRYIKAKP